MRITPALLEAWPTEGHRVHVRFEDGLAAEVDLSYLLGYGGVFEPLRDPEFFRQVSADTEAGTITWPGEVDIAPETLYEDARRVGGAARAPRRDRPASPPRDRGGEKPARPAPCTGVPRISSFYGIVIRMFYREAHHQGRPHFHAEYGGDKATFDIESLELIAGKLPRRARGLVLEWARAHQEELRENWRLARDHGQPKPIDPLA